MKKRLLFAGFFVLILAVLTSCVEVTEARKREYGVLESAVSLSSNMVIGEYGSAIPNAFGDKEFLRLVKGAIPQNYYDALEKCRLEIVPKKTYYLLKAYRDGQLILFDYSCTAQVDGPVLLEPGRYDLRRLEAYDACGNP